MLKIRVDCDRINGRYTNAEYRGKITRCDLTLNTGPYAGGCGGTGVRSHSPGWVNYFKIMQILPEIEFTPLIVASKSAPPL